MSRPNIGGDSNQLGGHGGAGTQVRGGGGGGCGSGMESSLRDDLRTATSKLGCVLVRVITCG